MDSLGALDVQVCAMRTGITVKVAAAERDRLKAIVADRSSPQKHVWRAGIVLATAEGLGTMGIMERTAKSKTAVWRWQERFAQEGVDGLLRDKTRPSRIKPFGPEVAERIVALTLAEPPGETTHWTGRAMAKVTAFSTPTSSVSGARTGFSLTASARSSSRTTLSSRPKSETSSASIRPAGPRRSSFRR